MEDYGEAYLGAWKRFLEAHNALIETKGGEESHQKGMALLKAVDHLMQVILKHGLQFTSKGTVNLIYVMMIAGINVRLACYEKDMKAVVDSWEHYAIGNTVNKEGENERACEGNQR